MYYESNSDYYVRKNASLNEVTVPSVAEGGVILFEAVQ